jgi:hypothetical protein
MGTTPEFGSLRVASLTGEKAAAFWASARRDGDEVSLRLRALAEFETHRFDTCLALSVERGAAPGQGNSSNPGAQHNAFMRQCLEGKIPR